MKSEIPTKRVRIDERLLEQIDYYSALFPKGMWTREGRTNYCVQIGLAAMLLIFKAQAEKKPAEAENGTAWIIQDVLRRVEKMNLPQSDVKRLLDFNLYGEMEKYPSHTI